MSSLGAPLALPLGGDDSLQARLQAPFSRYALEQLRARFLYTVTDTHAPEDSAAVTIQMAFETEVGTVLTKLVYVPNLLVPLSAFNTVASRRRFLDIDQDMRRQKYLVSPAADALAETPGIPVEYVQFFRRYLLSDYPRYRMSAIAGMLCLGKVV